MAATSAAIAAWVVANAGTIATVAGAAATVAGGYSAYREGKEQKKAYDRNADILRQNAAKKRLETSLNEDIIRSQNRQKMSKARAAFAEAGMATSATTSGVLGQMGAEQEENALLTRYQGETEAVNYMNQANLQSFYGKQAAKQGRNAFNMSLIKAGVSLLGAWAASGTGAATEGASKAFIGGSKAAAQKASLATRTGMSGVSSSINANGSLNFARLF